MAQDKSNSGTGSNSSAVPEAFQMPPGGLTVEQAVEEQLTLDPELQEEDTASDDPEIAEDDDVTAEETIVPDDEDDPAEASASDDLSDEDDDVDDDSEQYEEITLAEDDILFEHEGNPISLAEAQRGYWRQDKFTQHGQELATKRKAAETMTVEAQRERDNYATAVTQLRQVYKQFVDEAPANLDELRENDPTAYLVEKERMNEQQARLKSLEDEEARMNQEKQQAHQKQFAEWATKENVTLMEALPGWKDPEEATREKGQISNYLGQRGFTPDEIKQVFDHRLILVFRDAMKGSALKSKKGVVSRKMAKAKPMLRRAGGRQPTGNKSAKRSRVQRASKQLDKSGSFEDAVALQTAQMAEAEPTR